MFDQDDPGALRLARQPDSQVGPTDCVGKTRGENTLLLIPGDLAKPQDKCFYMLVLIDLIEQLGCPDEFKFAVISLFVRGRMICRRRLPWPVADFERGKLPMIGGRMNGCTLKPLRRQAGILHRAGGSARPVRRS